MTEIATIQHTSLFWITKFTRPSRAVHISKKDQPIKQDSEEQPEPTNVDNIEDNSKEIQKEPINEQIDKHVEINEIKKINKAIIFHQMYLFQNRILILV